MATATKVCKVCNKTYEYCRTLKRIEGVFRWQEVACCPEHGSIYLSKIRASRTASKPVAEPQSVDTIMDVYDDFDILFEEDFDDSEEEFEL